MIILTLARKPIQEGSVSANILKWGVGGLNIDESRVGNDIISTHNRGSCTAYPKWVGCRTVEHTGRKRRQDLVNHTPREGRWPANLILEHTSGCAQVGTKIVPTSSLLTHHKLRENLNVAMSGKNYARTPRQDWGSGGVEEIDSWNCQPGCPVADLDAQSGLTVSALRKGGVGDRMGLGREGWRFRRQEGGFEDAGGASRFFKQVHEPPEFFRAGGDCLCPVCEQEYRQHPHDYGQVDSEGEPILRVLCDGARVKL